MTEPAQPVSPPHGGSNDLSAEQLAGAKFAQFGGTLIVTAAGGQVFIVPGFFSGPDLGLPPGMDPDQAATIDLDAFRQIVADADAATRQEIAKLGGNSDEIDALLDDIAKGDGDSPEDELETAAGGATGGPGTNVELPGGLDAGARYGAGGSGDGFGPTTRGLDALPENDPEPVIGGGGEAGGPRGLGALSFSGPNGQFGTSGLDSVAPIPSLFAGGLSAPQFDGNVALNYIVDPPTIFDWATLRADIAASDPKPQFVVFSTSSSFLDDVAPGEPYITFVDSDPDAAAHVPYSTYVNVGYEFTLAEGLYALFFIDGNAKATDLDAAEGINHKLDQTQGHYYTPDHRHGAALNIVIHTTLQTFDLTDPGFRDDIRAFPSNPVSDDPDTLIDNAPDLIFYNSGIMDKDVVSFYDRDDPYGGNGNYSLSDPVSYSKLIDVSILDAVGYGVNDVRLNFDAIQAMTPVEETDWGRPDPEQPPPPSFPYHKMIVLGEEADTATLTDESEWTYTGIVDDPNRLVSSYLGSDVVGGAILPPTRDEYGTAFYEFEFTGDNEGMRTFIWVSDDFGDHPDFYWTGTEENDTAEFPDTEFGAVDALGGFDTLFLNNAETTLVESFVGTGGGIDNFEAVSLIDNGSADTITLDHAFVISATDEDNYLFIYGDTGDSVIFAPGDDWRLLGRLQDPDGDADDTYIYLSAGDGGLAAVYVDVDLAVTGAGTNPATAGNNVLFVNTDEFGAIDGLGGFDRLSFLQEDQIDLTNLAPGNSIANIEVLDITNGESNELVFDAPTMNLFGASELYIIGDANGDTLTLADAPQWTQGATYAAGDYNLVSLTTSEGGANLQLWVDENLI